MVIFRASGWAIVENICIHRQRTDETIFIWPSQIDGAFFLKRNFPVLYTGSDDKVLERPMGQPRKISRL